MVAFDAKRRDRGEVARWLEIAAKVSHLAGEQADIAENHYAHLSPAQF